MNAAAPLRSVALSLALMSSACAVEEADSAGAPLQVDTLDATSVAGTFVHGASVIEFRSEAPDARFARLTLEVNGAVFEVELNLADQLYSEEGNRNALYEPELAALLALRDELQAGYPELRETLHGTLLVRHTDRLAEAPIGYTHDYRFIDLERIKAKQPVTNQADADGCGGDGATCLPGTNGWDYAVYDPGSNGTCVWRWAQYGENSPNCSGRCGAGCNHWFDDDYTWDCFDHDRCVDHYGGSKGSDSPNCGDEYWDAADDYVVTYGPWC